MSRPPVDPDKTLAGIIVDPQTLERIVPESRRADGSERKKIKIRPGFTPQEDIRRFRGTKQQQMDVNALPKGHIIGWTPPPAAKADETKPLTNSAKKNAKRKEKRAEKKRQSGEAVPESWDDDDDDNDDVRASKDAGSAMKPTQESSTAEELADKLEKLKVEGV